jgi:hypothetical protein
MLALVRFLAVKLEPACVEAKGVEGSGGAGSRRLLGGRLNREYAKRLKPLDDAAGVFVLNGNGERFHIKQRIRLLSYVKAPPLVPYSTT